MVSTSRGRDRSLDFDEGGWQVVGSRVFETFRQAPVSVFFHVRDTLGAIFGSHRREWLQRTQVQFQRGGFKALPLRSGEATAPGFRSRFFFYQVEPATKRWPADNVPPLEKIQAFAYSGSDVALAHEFGATITPKKGRNLAIPIGVSLNKNGQPIARWRTPAKYRKAKAGNTLVALDLGHGPTLYQVQKATAAQSRKVGAISRLSNARLKRKDRRVLLPAYQLVRKVTVRPRLKFYATWDDLASDRARRWSGAMDRIMAEIND